MESFEMHCFRLAVHAKNMFPRKHAGRKTNENVDKAAKRRSGIFKRGCCAIGRTILRYIVPCCGLAGRRGRRGPDSAGERKTYDCACTELMLYHPDGPRDDGTASVIGCCHGITEDRGCGEDVGCSKAAGRRDDEIAVPAGSCTEEIAAPAETYVDDERHCDVSAVEMSSRATTIERPPSQAVTSKPPTTILQMTTLAIVTAVRTTTTTTMAIEACDLQRRFVEVAFMASRLGLVFRRSFQPPTIVFTLRRPRESTPRRLLAICDNHSGPTGSDAVDPQVNLQRESRVDGNARMNGEATISIGPSKKVQEKLNSRESRNRLLRTRMRGETIEIEPIGLKEWNPTSKVYGLCMAGKWGTPEYRYHVATVVDPATKLGSHIHTAECIVRVDAEKVSAVASAKSKMVAKRLASMDVYEKLTGRRREGVIPALPQRS